MTQAEIDDWLREHDFPIDDTEYLVNLSDERYRQLYEAWLEESIDMEEYRRREKPTPDF